MLMGPVSAEEGVELPALQAQMQQAQESIVVTLHQEKLQ
jgi:hypothetical protein